MHIVKIYKYVKKIYHRKHGFDIQSIQTATGLPKRNLCRILG